MGAVEESLEVREALRKFLAGDTDFREAFSDSGFQEVEYYSLTADGWQLEEDFFSLMEEVKEGGNIAIKSIKNENFKPHSKSGLALARLELYAADNQAYIVLEQGSKEIEGDCSIDKVVAFVSEEEMEKPKTIFGLENLGQLKYIDFEVNFPNKSFDASLIVEDYTLFGKTYKKDYFVILT